MSATRRQVLKGAAAAAAAATISGRVAAQSPVQITASITPSIFGTMFEEMVATFNARHPSIKVAIEGRHRAQNDALQALLRQGLIGDLPDLSFQGTYYLPVLRERGLSTRLDELIAAEKDWEERGMAGAVQATGMTDGETHSLGAALSFQIVYYNCDLVRRAGGDPDRLPQDWDGIIDLAKRIGALGGGIQGGFYQYASSFSMTSPLESMGGRMVNEKGKFSFNSPQGLRVLQIMRAFGELGQSKYDVQQDQARSIFGSGVIGVLVDSSSSLLAFEQAAAGRFDLRTAPIPLAPQGRSPASATGSVLHAKNPARRAAAWEFMKFASGVEGQTIVGKGTGYTVANVQAIKDPRYLAPHYAKLPNMAAANKTAETAARLFIFPGENSVKVDAEVRVHLRDLFVLKLTPEQAMAAIEKTVRALVPGIM